MRKQLRRKLAQKIKEFGLPTKLYRGSKFKFYRRFSTNRMVRLLDKLSLCVPGTVVEDCDYANHVVRGFYTTKFRHSNRWYGGGRGYFFDFDGQVEFEDGRLSCGCPVSPCTPSTREEIESDYLTWCEEENVETAVDDFTGKPYPACVIARLQALRAGQHITDERGIMLPEFYFKLEDLR